nr:MAG TPA: hypothetical protein [Caudoviricetes sp.]
MSYNQYPSRDSRVSQIKIGSRTCHKSLRLLLDELSICLQLCKSNFLM